MAKVATQAGVLRAFRMDDDPVVLKAVLANKKTPNDVRCRIVREAAPEVQEVLCDAVNYLAIPFYFECKPHLTAKTRAGICQREGLNTDILLDLVHDAEESVRMAVALELESKARTHFPVLIHKILNDFLRDPSEKVRLAIIPLTVLTHEHAHKLLCDASENVRAAMAAHLLKKLGDFRREKILASYEELYLEFASQLTAMAEDPSHKVRLTLAAAIEHERAQDFQHPAPRDQGTQSRRIRLQEPQECRCEAQVDRAASHGHAPRALLLLRHGHQHTPPHALCFPAREQHQSDRAKIHSEAGETSARPAEIHLRQCHQHRCSQGCGAGI
jgi:hypothetical protein